MNNISKILCGLVVGILISGVMFTTSDAARFIKSNNVITTDANNGKSVPHPAFDIKSHYRFASTTEAIACTGKCLLYDVIMTSGADGAYAIIYDSATGVTAGVTSVIVSKMEFDGTGIPKALSAGNSSAFPIITTYGIGVDLSSVSGSEEILVIYKDTD